MILPLSFASPITGVIQSLGTPWAFFRYWVVARILITLPATGILLLHRPKIAHVANVAAETTLAPNGLHEQRLQLVASAATAVVALLVATVLSVFKPQGRIDPSPSLSGCQSRGSRSRS